MKFIKPKTIYFIFLKSNKAQIRSKTRKYCPTMKMASLCVFFVNEKIEKRNAEEFL